VLILIQYNVASFRTHARFLLTCDLVDRIVGMGNKSGSDMSTQTPLVIEEVKIPAKNGS
jgi:hypothetical protein